MKVKCKMNVQDKHTGEWYVTDKVYEFTEERAAEVVKAYNGRYFEYVSVVTKKDKEIITEYGNTKVTMKEDSVELNVGPKKKSTKKTKKD